MANTFISLDDTPVSYEGLGFRFLRVNGSEDSVLATDINLDTLTDIEANGVYSPSVGQTLVFHANGKWRPATLDVYSAGNGLNKSGLVLNVEAGVGGGLVSNADGVYIEDIANVAATWGNASHVPVFTVNNKGQITGVTPTQIVAQEATTITDDFVSSVSGTTGQIRVVGGTGNAANATIDLVATGVTAATYGNATHLPQITVDTYGRIQNVDLIEIAGGNVAIDGNAVVETYKTISVPGQTQLAADQIDDNLNIVAGAGIQITTEASSDTLTISANASTGSIADLSDIDITGVSDGQILVYNSSAQQFEASNQTGGVALTDLSVTILDPDGNGSLSYNNTTGVFSFTPANIQAASGGSVQTLSWNPSTTQLTISDSNTVDLGTLEQTLSLASNVITLSGSNSSVDLTSTLAQVSGNYGDSNVLALAESFGGNIVPSTSNVYSLGTTQTRWKELHLSGDSIFINGSVLSDNNGALNYNNVAIATENYVDAAVANVSVDLTGYATESYVDSAVSAVIDGANINLDTLAEVSNALANSNAQISTVAFTGDYDDLVNRPSIALEANAYLLYNGANIDLTGVGAQGPKGDTGDTGIGIVNAAVTNDELIFTYSNTTVQNLGNIRGPQGPQGDAGTDGADGVGIVSTTIVGSNLVIDYSNTSTQDLGSIQGPAGADGADGADGTSISSATVNGSGNLILTLTDASTVDAGNVRGADGNVQLSDFSVVQNSASGTGSLSYNSSTGVYTYTPPDLSGFLTSETDSQTLSFDGANLSISGGNTVDLSSLNSGGIADLSGNVISDLGDISSATPTDGQALVWDSGNSVWAPGSVSSSGGIALTDLSGGIGIDYDNSTGEIALANTSVSAGTYGSTTKSARITVDAQGRITDVTEATISGGSGSGAKIERFKLNYASNGNLVSATDDTDGISAITIDSTTGGEVSITFDSGYYNFPPGAVMLYGYDYSNNNYIAVPLDTSNGLRVVSAGGSSGSPTLFDGAGTVTIQLRLRETETGASRGGFGTTTHAWIQFMMYD